MQVCDKLIQIKIVDTMPKSRKLCVNFTSLNFAEYFGILGIFRFGKPSTKTKLEWNIACILSADLR